MRVLLVSLIFFLLAFAEWNPKANPAAVVTLGKARFTVLTSQLFRMEYSNGSFEDRASFAVVNRYLPVPSFKSNVQSNVLIIQTDHVTIKYNSSNPGPFSDSNLQISFLIGSKWSTWSPTKINSGNLLGTIRTLDGVNGSINLNCTEQTKPNLFCTFGLISTLGYSLVDDTATPILIPDNDYGLWVSPDGSVDNQDWYFFGHGKDYKKALSDFTQISGKIPMPPRFAFGVYFSRYWAYSQQDTVELIDQYQAHGVPLDVLVTDMDWHITFYKEASEGKKDQAGQTVGWTGYTWDPQLFPTPKGLLDYCKELGLRNTLNLHPASGVQPHELRYPQMASAMGQDPSLKIYVPFNITNKKYANNLHDIMLRPLNDQGIDFWWLDWQQYENTDIANLNPTMWLNHVFFNNFKRWNSPQRSMILHRWGGLGNHRYQIGFSGDVTPSWESLHFQVYFTATAANVGYAYWSHDIGGHTEVSPPELYTRWVQWGIFSPAFRPHCTKNAENDRRIWTYPLYNFQIMRDAILLRAQLIPYLYTTSRITYDSGIPSIVKPMYYEYPDAPESYIYLRQYLFGESMLVSPITAPLDPTTQLSSQTIWIPTGSWIEWYTGTLIQGPAVVTRNFALTEVPIYVKAGSIIPYNTISAMKLFGNAQTQQKVLGLMLFPGLSTKGSFKVYDDAGDSPNYDTEHTWTNVEFTSSGAKTTLTIHAVEGSYPGMLDEMAYEIKIMFVYPLESAFLNGQRIPHSREATPDETNWSYIGTTQTVVVSIPTNLSRHSNQIIDFKFIQPTDKQILNGLTQQMARAQIVKVLLDQQWGQKIWQEDYESLVLCSTEGSAIGDIPSNAVSVIRSWSSLYSKAIKEVGALNLQPSVKSVAVAQLTNSAKSIDSLPKEEL